MEQQDIKEIIKEWLEEWRNPTEAISDSDEDLEIGKDKEKEKGKEKIREKKKKEHTGEKRKALQEEPTPYKRQKMKAQRHTETPQLGKDDYDNIGNYMQESLEESMTVIVSS